MSSLCRSSQKILPTNLSVFRQIAKLIQCIFVKIKLLNDYNDFFLLSEMRSRRHAFLLLFFVFRLWLFLSEHYDLEYEVGNPCLAQIKTLVVLTYRNNGFHYSRVVEIVFVEDV